MRKLFLVIALLAFGAIVAACGVDTPDEDPETSVPVIEGVENTELPQDATEFDALEGVTATDEEDGDLTDQIEVEGEIEFGVFGDYFLTYTVTNSAGETATAERRVSVGDWVYAEGTYNFRFAPVELRNTLFGAAERFLIETMAGGVPVFANAGFVMYSHRVVLPVDEFVPVMGWGAIWGEMTEDDSTVVMDDGQPGNEGEYTYRSRLGQNPDTLHQWIYSDATSSDVITLFLDGLYYFRFNEDLDGFEVSHSMASGDPIPIEMEVLPTGAEVAKTWQIPVKDGLVWSYHEDVDTSEFPEGHENITAESFVETFQLAMDEGWFRAVAGGGDFTSPPQEIVNAQAYIDGEVDWEDVGIKYLEEDNAIEFTFVENMDDWSVRYWLSSFVMTPVNMPLYEQAGEQYGTSETTVAFNGPFVLDYYEPDSILRYSANPNFHDPDRYFYTGYAYNIIEDAEIAFQEFLDGRLDAAGVDPSEYETYQDDPRIRAVPGATTFRIMINGLGTPEAQADFFEGGPGEDYTPEPILASDFFKRAMYFAIDRETLAYDVMITSEPNQFLFSHAYLVDPAGGIAFRETQQGQDVGKGFSPGTYGFNADAARAYWLLALDETIQAGHYSPGTAANPTIIEIELNVFSGSESQVRFGDFIKESFESTFQDAERHIYVEVDVFPRDFPSIYFDYMMTGVFDLSIGGISGSTLDASSFLDVFADDNRSGFTLNWGIDTSSANIIVEYEDAVTEETVREKWSFNALQRALVGTVYVEQGEESVAPEEEE